MNLLILGGSGGLSGCLAKKAITAGHSVWTVTRGIRPLPTGVNAIYADRHNKEELFTGLSKEKTHWDAVLDCICMNESDARDDMQILRIFTDRLVVISTDSVYDPKYKTVPQTEYSSYYLNGDDYAGNKRAMEEIFEKNTDSNIAWTVFRPGHIYGPGFLLGCYPEHSRQKNLLEYIRGDNVIRLVGGGKHMIHPVFVEDLADSMLDCIDKSKTFNEIFCIGGPNAVPNEKYYMIIGELVGHPVKIESIPEEGYVDEHPEYGGHVCERSYSLEKLRNAGVCLPQTTLEDGLTKQIKWLDNICY